MQTYKYTQALYYNDINYNNISATMFNVDPAILNLIWKHLVFLHIKHTVDKLKYEHTQKKPPHNVFTLWASFKECIIKELELYD
jgi:hypothetical protein